MPHFYFLLSITLQ